MKIFWLVFGFINLIQIVKINTPKYVCLYNINATLYDVCMYYFIHICFSIGGYVYLYFATDN